MSSPSIRRGPPSSPRLSIQQVAERSQRQLIVTAVLGTLCTLLIVLMFILFHEVVPLGVDSVTGSSVIETEQHIRHMFAMGHHKEALGHLNDLIQEKPLHRWEQHLNLMDELLRKSNLQTSQESSSSSQEDEDQRNQDLKEDLFKQVEFALEVIEKLKRSPDSAEALSELNQHTSSILSSCLDSNHPVHVADVDDPQPTQEQAVEKKKKEL